MKRILVALPVVLVLGLLVPPAMSLDPVAPEVSQLSLSFRPRLGSEAIPVKVTWSATSPNGICKYVLSVAVLRPFQTTPLTFKALPLATPTSTTAVSWERPGPGNTYYFSLDVYDCAGNAFIDIRHLKIYPARHEETAATLIGDSWTSESEASASGGSVASATIDGDSAIFGLCAAGQFGVFMTKGPDEGSIDIYIDDLPWKLNLSLYSPTVLSRHLVYQHRFRRVPFDTGHHIEIVKSGGTRIDLDAVARLSNVFQRC